MVFLNAGADPNMEDLEKGYGVSPLRGASSNGHKDVVRLLLDYGAKPNLASGDHGLTALHIAVLHGHNDVVELLLDGGADPNAVDLLKKMLTYDPEDRITFPQALEHPYLSALHFPDDEPVT